MTSTNHILRESNPRSMWFVDVELPQDVRSPPNFAMSATSFLNFTNPVEFVDSQACHFG